MDKLGGTSNKFIQARNSFEKEKTEVKNA